MKNKLLYVIGAVLVVLIAVLVMDNLNELKSTQTTTPNPVIVTVSKPESKTSTTGYAVTFSLKSDFAEDKTEQ